LLGAIGGALQALVIRQAASAIGPWIEWSAIGGTSAGVYSPSCFSSQAISR